jgi:nucleotide-binding universal stress UspA family protein
LILGKTVERLLRHSPTPVLIVRNRARASYRHILVPTDFSDSSARALHAALRFFRTQQLHLLHAFDLPYATLIRDFGGLDNGYATDDMEFFLASMNLSLEERLRLTKFIERGRPDPLIRAYVSDQDADLVILGTHGRHALLEALTGSTAKTILSALPCDTLIVRAGPSSNTTELKIRG